MGMPPAPQARRNREVRVTDTNTRPAVGKIRNEQDHGDLLSYHLTLIGRAQTAVDAAKIPVAEAKADLSDANEDLTKAFNAAKGDLGRGYTREYLGGLIADGRKKITEQVNHEQMRARDKALLNQPVFGVQAELFPGEETPLEAKDEMAWEAEGYQRGRRGDLEELQPGDPPRFQQAIMRGFEAGQKTTMERFARAEALRLAEQTPDAEAEAVSLNEPEPGTPEAKEAEGASIDRAKESLAAMGGGEADLAADIEPAHVEPKPAEKPRLSVVRGKGGDSSNGASPAAA
jgi:hypothetical protein